MKLAHVDAHEVIVESNRSPRVLAQFGLSDPVGEDRNDP